MTAKFLGDGTEIMFILWIQRVGEINGNNYDTNGYYRNHTHYPEFTS